MGSLHSLAELKVTGAGVGWVEREMRGDRIFVQNNFRCSVPYVLALTLPVWSPRAAERGAPEEMEQVAS